MRNLRVITLLTTLFLVSGGTVVAQDVAVPVSTVPPVPAIPAAPAAPPAAHSELQTQVEALLESGPFAIHGADIAYPTIIYAFYSHRGFQPAWTNAHTASELRRALRSEEHTSEL